jgi:hypothetical protein
MEAPILEMRAMANSHGMAHVILNEEYRRVISTRDLKNIAIRIMHEAMDHAVYDKPERSYKRTGAMRRGVRGYVTWNEGMGGGKIYVSETVERKGYYYPKTVQKFTPFLEEAHAKTRAEFIKLGRECTVETTRRVRRK